MLRAIVLCCSVAVLGTVGTASAQDWTKSKWGPNDEIGAANYMTPELVLKAASLVKTGKTYALGFPLDDQHRAMRIDDLLRVRAVNGAGKLQFGPVGPLLNEIVQHVVFLHLTPPSTPAPSPVPD